MEPSEASLQLLKQEKSLLLTGHIDLYTMCATCVWKSNFSTAVLHVFSIYMYMQSAHYDGILTQMFEWSKFLSTESILIM